MSDDTAKFKIDGEEYDIPDLGTFDMDEALILYEQCGLALEDFAFDEDDPEQVAELNQKVKHPGFIRSLMIVAYIRGNPGMSKQKASSMVGKSNLFEAVKDFFGSVEQPDPTKAQESEPSENPSTEKSDGKTTSSGDDLPKSLAAQAESPSLTGTSVSATSPVSAPTT